MLTDYTGLKAAIATWLDRTDLTTQLDDFIALAESDIRTDVRVPAMEQYTTGTLTGETLAQPDRFVEARLLRVGGNRYTYNTPDEYLTKKDGSSTERVFTSIGQNLYILNGASGDAYTLIYYQAFEALSTTSENWLLTNCPGAYLWASCRYGGLFIEDDAKTGKFTGQYQDAIGRLVSRERNAAVAGPLVIKSSARE